MVEVAIAGQQAAEIHRMEVLAEDLADSPENYTRFIVLGRERLVPESPAKTSILFSVENVPGALCCCLEPFAVREVDLTKIESRPPEEATLGVPLLLRLPRKHPGGPGGAPGEEQLPSDPGELPPHDLLSPHSHSMVAGGLLVIS